VLTETVAGRSARTLDVALGETLAELRQRRPGLHVRPNIGWGEAVGPDTVFYLFAKENEKQTLESLAMAPPEYEEAARVVAVELVQRFESDSATMSWAHGLVSRLREHGPPKCEFFITGFARVYEISAHGPYGFVGALIYFPGQKPRPRKGEARAFHTMSLGLVFPFKGTRSAQDCDRLPLPSEPKDPVIPPGA
jgi:hypothetical protein